MVLRSGEVYFSEQSRSFSVPEAISLFGFSISFYGLFLVAAALAGTILTMRRARRQHQNVEWNLTLITLVIVSALVGARIYYLLFEWQAFVREPLALLNFRSGGLSYFGALFGAWFTVKWYCHRKNAGFSQSADSLCMGAAVAAPFVWGGCAFAREPLGRFYNGTFAISIGTEYLPNDPEGVYSAKLLSNAGEVSGKPYLSMHPVAIYGVVLSIVVFAVLCLYRRMAKQRGELFTMYLFLNAVTSIVLEFFREDRCLIWGTKIPVNYVVAGVLLVTIAAGWIRQMLSKRKAKKSYTESFNQSGKR